MSPSSGCLFRSSPIPRSKWQDFRDKSDPSEDEDKQKGHVSRFTHHSHDRRKRKREESGQVLGPSVTGAVANEELVRSKYLLGSSLASQKQDSVVEAPNQGWIEYLLL